jgi:hypothetical protein
MDENLKNQIYTFRLRTVLYLTAILIPWLFAFEILPFEYGAFSVFTEVTLYILWSLVLIFSIVNIRKEIKAFHFDSEVEYSNKRMWKVVYSILYVFLIITTVYLLITLVLIMVSYLL